MPIPVTKRIASASQTSRQVSASADARHDHNETAEPDEPRTEAVAEPPARDLHGRVGHEQHRRHEPDDGERDAVRVRDGVGDGADAGQAPAGREREHESTGRGAHAHGGDCNGKDDSRYAALHSPPCGSS